VPDDDCVLVTAEGFVQRVGIACKCGGLIHARWRNTGRRIPALEGRYRAVTPLGQHGHEVAPRMWRVGETVHAQREWTASAGEIGEIQFASSHGCTFEGLVSSR
jgi:hypothetical protein